MPIMAAHGQNDARVAARLLASTAVDCLRDPATAGQWEVALNNVYRLLESFRINQFFGHEAPSRKSPHGAPETLSLVPPMERHVKEVRLALAKALDVTFADQPRDEAIVAVEKVLQGLAYPHKFGEPSHDELQRATRFFEGVLEHLKFV